MTRYYIIQDNKRITYSNDIRKINAAVFVNLFYEEQIGFYLEYLKEIPDFIDIYIISSNKRILAELEEYPYKKIKKENRGRDISALLVAVRDIIFQYEYICFIHDKKERKLERKKYTDLWRKNLWDNMLQSSIYIENILSIFEDNTKLGMLVPLPPYEQGGGVWLNGAWGRNYVKLKDLALEMDIKAEICFENPPFTYSTVFWARTEAIKKLFARRWKYTDFPNEPLEDDGEINHAIERILQYVVEDAGFETKICLSTMYAALFIERLHSDIIDLWNQMDLNMGIGNYEELGNFNLRVEKLKKFRGKYKSIYLYGGGKIGRRCLRLCEILDIFPKGIIVTKPEDGQVMVEGIPVIGISDFVLSKGTGIIVSVGANYHEEIKSELKKRNIESYIFF